MSASGSKTPGAASQGLGPQIAELRALFQATGALHETHVFNLKVWPRLVFPQVTSTATVDPDGRRVTFELRKRWWARLPKDWRERCRGLHESVQGMLGMDMETVVVLDGKAIFSGERIQPVESPSFEGTDFEAGRVVPSVPWNFHPKKKS